MALDDQPASTLRGRRRRFTPSTDDHASGHQDDDGNRGGDGRTATATHGSTYASVGRSGTAMLSMSTSMTMLSAGTGGALSGSSIPGRSVCASYS